MNDILGLIEPAAFLQNFRNALVDKPFESLTILILAFTAWAGFRASRAASETNELRLLPILTIYFEGYKLADTKLFIKNLGEGAAFNIEVTPWRVILTDIQKIWELRMILEGTNVISRGESKEILAQAFTDNQKVALKDLMLAHMHPDSSSSLPRIPITINFKNALGKDYYTEIETGRGGVKILTPPRRLTQKNKVFIFSKINS